MSNTNRSASASASASASGSASGSTSKEEKNVSKFERNSRKKYGKKDHPRSSSTPPPLPLPNEHDSLLDPYLLQTVDDVVEHTMETIQEPAKSFSPLQLDENQSTNEDIIKWHSPTETVQAIPPNQNQQQHHRTERTALNIDPDGHSIINFLTQQKQALIKGIYSHKKTDPKRKYQFLLPKTDQWLFNPEVSALPQMKAATTADSKPKSEKNSSKSLSLGKKRGNYRCTICGKSKKNHICSGKITKDSACQTDTETKISLDSGIRIVTVSAAISDEVDVVAV